jgi:hypothetical protein
VGAVIVLTGIDTTATQANPVQCFTNYSLGGSTIFYWESQSTGEGNGVTFSWRGALPLPFGQTLVVDIHAVATIHLAGVAFGYVTPDLGIT